MDITKFIVQGREKALLYGDYSTYHAQLAKRLLSSRKKLGIATKNRGKFQKKDEVSAENIAENHEYLHLLLLTVERAWAQAMSFKATHSNGPKGIVGRTRSHIASRLEKASKVAQHIVQVLSQKEVTGASTEDILEAKAYATLIRGTMFFEKQSWKLCVENYAVSRVIYIALGSKGQEELYKDLLAETIDPSIRYAAYQLKTPRTVPISVIARKTFPKTNESLVQQVNSVEPGALSGELDARDGLPTAENAPRTLVWRSREVNIEDAQIALAWAKVGSAKEALKSNFTKQTSRAPHQIAATYDGILTATQDAVDATKEAIDEIRKEGVGQSDARMQSLQITRTAVNYEMISWRIGRNRVLTGADDGAVEDYTARKKAKKANASAEDEGKLNEASVSRKLTKLREKIALYDGTLQNLQSAKELPGIAADEGLASKLDASISYFNALKALSIARSHAIIGNFTNALALIHHASQQCKHTSNLLSENAAKDDITPPNIDIKTSEIEFLTKLINGELQRHRAIVHIENLRKEEQSAAPVKKTPLVQRLYEYPIGDVDLDNIVEFPPKPSFIPVKPIFLDIAWNYINYPGQSEATTNNSAAGDGAATEGQAAEQPKEQQKRGWFGFGRS